MELEAGLLIGQLLLKYGPGVARGVAGIFAKPTHTLEDWEKIFKLTEKSYEDYTKPTTT